MILILSLWPAHTCLFLPSTAHRSEEVLFFQHLRKGSIPVKVAITISSLITSPAACIGSSRHSALSGSGSGLVKNQEFSACRCMITTVHKDHMPSHPHIKVKLMTDLSILQPQANPHLLVRPPHFNARALPPLYPCNSFAPVCWLKC